MTAWRARSTASNSGGHELARLGDLAEVGGVAQQDAAWIGGVVPLPRVASAGLMLPAFPTCCCGFSIAGCHAPGKPWALYRAIAVAQAGDAMSGGHC